MNDLDYINKMSDKMTSKQRFAEIWKCKSNPFYFIYNWVYIPEIGGVLKYNEDIMHAKMKSTLRSVMIYHRALLMASRQLGKALHIDTPIPLANGEWTTMEHLQIGDLILDDNFLPTKVINTTEIMYNHDCFKLEFDVGEEIIADRDHLWKVYDPFEKSEHIYTSEEIYNHYQFGKLFDIRYKDGKPSVHLNDIDLYKSVPVKCIKVSNHEGMFLCGKNKIPTHNSTFAACLLEWAANFFPKLPATILNANKTFALENLEKVKFIHLNLPKFLQSPLKFRGERKTTIDYENGSTIRVFFPSSTTTPSSLARSLTSPVLYIDEAAHIPH